MARGNASRAGVQLSEIAFDVRHEVNRDVVGLASELMRASWVPPCLDYTQELLEWQLTFPGSPSPLYIVGLDKGRCVAFAAASPRRLRYGTWSQPFLIKSFVTVAKELRGRGVGRDLRRRIVSEIARDAHPIVRFGEIATPALEEDYRLSGMTISYQGPCVAMATMSDGRAEPRLLSVQEYAEATRTLARPGGLALDAQADVLVHYLSDPRGRTFLGVLDHKGDLAVAAMVVRARMVGRGGVVVSVQLEQLIGKEGVDTSEIRELAAASAQWGYGGQGMVTIPNIGTASLELLAEAGFRQIPGRYSAWVAHPVGEPLPFESVKLNLEIV